MGQPQVPATPDEALDWVRRMMVVYTPDTANRLKKMTLAHEQVIMGGWDPQRYRYFPGILVNIANINRWIIVLFAMTIITMLGTSSPTWWPVLRGLIP